MKAQIKLICLYVYERNIHIFWNKILYFIHHIFIKVCKEAVTRPTLSCHQAHTAN